MTTISRYVSFSNFLTICLRAVLFFLLIASNSIAEESKEEFSKRLKDIIVQDKLDEFRKIPCYPNSCVNEETLELVFGRNDRISVYKNILQNQNLKIKYFGPYSIESGQLANSYSVIYYDPTLVSFGKTGHLNENDRVKYWNNGYIETVIVFFNGKWSFYRTPFYLGAHLPWMEDYG